MSYAWSMEKVQVEKLGQYRIINIGLAEILFGSFLQLAIFRVYVQLRKSMINGWKLKFFAWVGSVNVHLYLQLRFSLHLFLFLASCIFYFMPHFNNRFYSMFKQLFYSPGRNYDRKEKSTSQLLEKSLKKPTYQRNKRIKTKEMNKKY